MTFKQVCINCIIKHNCKEVLKCPIFTEEFTAIDINNPNQLIDKPNLIPNIKKYIDETKLCPACNNPVTQVRLMTSNYYCRKCIVWWETNEI
jgi:late competence protein required for DNA uptake (superfamily II DNA/RNA helicase)